MSRIIFFLTFYNNLKNKNMKANYYFKFEVQDSISHEHRTFKQAIRTAKRLKQDTVYLVLYITPNSYKEPFDEVEITDFNLSAQEVEQLKNDLLNNSKKYFNHENN